MALATEGEHGASNSGEQWPWQKEEIGLSETN